MSDPEDLEDGEIEDDEDEVQPEDPPLVQPTPADYTDFEAESHGKEPGGSEPQTQTNKSGGGQRPKPAPVVDDWATRVENAIASALIKDGVEPPMPTSVSHQGDGEEDSGAPVPGTGGGRRSKKRKKSSRGGGGDGQQAQQQHQHQHQHQQHHPPHSKQPRLDDPEDDGEMDYEYEMLNVRGSSPQDSAGHHRGGARDSGVSDSEEDDTHYSSDDSRDRGEGHFRGKQRGDHRAERDNRERDRERDRDREREREYNRKKRKQARQRSNNKVGRDGRKRKRDDSDDEKHRPTGPRKMELCKFYLMDCCAKREKCLYMHKDFPCKYYYLGMKCREKDKCLFSHGEPLSDDLRAILLKHLETAPQEILGDFQRISRDNAIGLVNATHRKLLERYGKGESKIPSLLDVPTVQPPVGPNHGHQNQKYRKSRWTGDHNGPPALDGETLDLLKQLTGVISPRQAQDLEQMGIRTLDEISQLTVAQLNELGLSITQIHDLQVRAMNVQKNREAKSSGAGSGNNQDSSGQGKAVPMDVKQPGAAAAAAAAAAVPPKSTLEDVDLRKMPPGVDIDAPAVLAGSRDVDMRLLPPVTEQPKESPRRGNAAASSNSNDSDTPAVQGSHQLLLKPPTVDYSQYIKDSNLDEDLDAVAADTSCLLNDPGDDDDVDDDDDENHLKINIEEEEEEEKKDQHHAGEAAGELLGDQGTLKRTDSGGDETSEQPTALLLPPLIPPKIDYAQGLGDILMYGSLDKSSAKTLGGGGVSPRSHHRSPSPAQDEGAAAAAAAKACLLQDAWTPSMADSSSSISSSNIITAASGTQQTKASSRSKSGQAAKTGGKGRTGGSSIYDWYDSDNVPSSPDGPSSPLGATSAFRYGSGGFDRLGTTLDLDDGDAYAKEGSEGRGPGELGFPFKSIMANYVPATEIDGSIGSHAPIHYKVYVVDVPKANYKTLRRSITRPVPSKDRPSDPRLRRLFGMQSDEDEGDDGTGSDAGIKSPDGSTPGASPLYNIPPSVPPPVIVPAANSSSAPVKLVSSGPRVDPRKRHAEKQLEAQQQQQQQQQQQSSSAFGTSPQIDVQAILQKSAWYKDLGSKHKIMVNQQLAILSTEMKKFHNSDRSTERLSEFMHFLGSSNMLQHILTCLNVFVDDSVTFCEVPVVPNLPPPGHLAPLPMVPHIPPPNMPALPLHVPPPIGVQGPMSLPPPLPTPGQQQMFGLGPTGAPFGRPPMQDQSQPPMVARPGLLGVSPNMPFEQFLAMGNVNKGGADQGGPGAIQLPGPIPPWVQGGNNNGGNNNGNSMRNVRNNNRIGHNFRNNNDRWNNNGGGGGGGGGAGGPQMMMGGGNNGGQGNNRRNNKNRRQK